MKFLLLMMLSFMLCSCGSDNSSSSSSENALSSSYSDITTVVNKMSGLGPDTNGALIAAMGPVGFSADWETDLFHDPESDSGGMIITKEWMGLQLDKDAV